MHEHEFPQVTRRSGFRYVFTRKHHGGDPKRAQWSPELPADQEFLVFDIADLNSIADDRQWLYGVLPLDCERSLRQIGTLYEQLAEFPRARNGDPWHGYPIWPLRQEKFRPNRTVFDKMVQAGLINRSQRVRLMKGDHV